VRWLARDRGPDAPAAFVIHHHSEDIDMLHGLVLAAQDNPQAAGFIVRSIKFVFYLIGGVIAAIVCAIVAAMKGRNPFGWGILGFFFSIITLIVILVIPSKKT
jgi:hypothetical protein